jgi:hypothetical protein
MIPIWLVKTNIFPPPEFQQSLLLDITKESYENNPNVPEELQATMQIRRHYPQNFNVPAIACKQ